MAFLFGGGRKPESDSVKDYQRKVACGARGLQREAARLDSREACLKRELDRCVKQGQIDDAKAKATEMVRLRAHRDKLRKMGGHLQGLGQQLSEVHSSARMQEIIGQTARILQALNTRIDAGTMQRMVTEYERQTSFIAAKTEMVGDALDGMFEVDGEEQESSETVCMVLKEAGLDLMDRMPSRSGEDRLDDGFVARIQALRVP